MSAAAVAEVSLLVTSVSMASAAQAERELRLVEIGFVLLLAACATVALVLLRSCGRKGR
ncbi:hypothetical protein ACIRVF_15195 [Kitasatospora sp. NPDC101157]|uniref:hypothetical protein n=1 Tax=Kitasatospora sp. NPDC101157 TaxID=3364098 RepID=UPI0038276AC6